MKFAVSLVALVVILGTFTVDQASGDCCPSDMFGRCGDHSTATPCCGYGPCNIFCCNCDNGCRPGFRSSGELPVDGFELIDTNTDGLVSFEEAEGHIARGGCGDPLTKAALVPAEFARLDLNSDGFLTKAEIDSK